MNSRIFFALNALLGIWIIPTNTITNAPTETAKEIERERETAYVRENNNNNNFKGIKWKYIERRVLDISVYRCILHKDPNSALILSSLSSSSSNCNHIDRYNLMWFSCSVLLLLLLRLIYFNAIIVVVDVLWLSDELMSLDNAMMKIKGPSNSFNVRGFVCFSEIWVARHLLMVFFTLTINMNHFVDTKMIEYTTSHICLFAYTKHTSCSQMTFYIYVNQCNNCLRQKSTAYLTIATNIHIILIKIYLRTLEIKPSVTSLTRCPQFWSAFVWLCLWSRWLYECVLFFFLFFFCSFGLRFDMCYVFESEMKWLKNVCETYTIDDNDAEAHLVHATNEGKIN